MNIGNLGQNSLKDMKKIKYDVVDVTSKGWLDVILSDDIIYSLQKCKSSRSTWRKLPRSAFFAIFEPLTSIKPLPNHFYLVEEVLSFDLVGHMWKLVRIGFRNEFLRFTSENEVDLDELHILKINFKNSLGIGMGNFPQDFLARFSHKIFLQEFPARISCKIFPQEFPTRFSHKNFPQDFPARISRKIFLQEFSARISHKNFPQEFPARFSCKNFRQDFPARISHKNFPQDFPELDPDWLTSHHPIPNAKFPPITALLNRPTYHKRSKVSPPPFPQILWEPQINE